MKGEGNGSRGLVGSVKVESNFVFRGRGQVGSAIKGKSFRGPVGSVIDRNSFRGQVGSVSETASDRNVQRASARMPK